MTSNGLAITGPRFGNAFRLRQESSRTELLAILRPCARLQSRSWWFLPSLTKAMELGGKRSALATSGYGIVDADRQYLDRPIALVDRDVSRLRIIGRMATAHRLSYRNCASFLLGAVQRSVICHYGGNRWGFEGILIHSRCIETSQCSFRD
jgi:hypothetical protein